MAKFTRGKLAVLHVALANQGDLTAEPAVGARMHLCATNSIKIGFGGKKIDFQNFCTSGNTVSVPGNKEPKLEIGEAQWADDDASLQMMENAGRDDQYVWYWYYPKGVAAGKGYKGVMLVNKLGDDQPQRWPYHRYAHPGAAGPGDQVRLLVVWRDSWAGKSEVVIIAPGGVRAGSIRDAMVLLHAARSTPDLLISDDGGRQYRTTLPVSLLSTEPFTAETCCTLSVQRIDRD